jgi:hypothetical protein
MRRSYWVGVPGLALLALLAVGAGGGPHAAPQHAIRETVAHSTTCPHGGFPFSEAAQKVPMLNNLPDGGTVTFTGTSFHTWYDPCSWTLSFTAPPPMSLLTKVLAVAPGGFGYSLGPQTPARPTKFAFDPMVGGFGVPAPVSHALSNYGTQRSKGR